MTNKTNFSPDGNLFIKGGLTSESFLDVAGEANFSGNVHIAGALTADGAITFNNTTVNTVQTTNNADGYVINADGDANSAYLQINSFDASANTPTSNVRFVYSDGNLTIAAVSYTHLRAHET